MNHLNQKQLKDELIEVRNTLVDMQKQHQQLIDQVHPKYKNSAINLLHYIALGKLDITQLQEKLSSLGISSLKSAHHHVLANIQAVLQILSADNEDGYQSEEEPVNIMHGYKLRKDNTAAIFGPVNDERYIMVTFPSDASTDYQLVKNMIVAGMNVARINCAKDSPREWQAMIKKVKKEELFLII